MTPHDETLASLETASDAVLDVQALLVAAVNCPSGVALERLVRLAQEKLSTGIEAIHKASGAAWRAGNRTE